MSVDSNSLAGFLAVYAQESLEQFIATMPAVNLFTKNFDSSVANGGQSVTTRISTTNWGTANDLSQGWSATVATSSAVTATLKLKDFDTIFNELEWSTITPQVLINTFFKPQAGQMANSMVVDAISNVTSSYYTNKIVTTASAFTVTGSTSLQTASVALDNLEMPTEGRYAIVRPDVYASLTDGILPTYFYGSPDVIQKNRIQELLQFSVTRYPRFYGASKPQGGDSYSGGDHLIGIAGVAEGLVMAVRAPVDPNNGLVQSATAVDPTSGLSLQTRIVYDVSKPGWRLAVVGLWGSTAGNSNGIIPIISYN